MARDPIRQSRMQRLANADPSYRAQYVGAYTRRMLARQLRELRGSMSQKAFAKKVGKAQTVISRLENPSYSGWTMRTMLEIATALDMAVIVRFVDYASFIEQSDEALAALSER